MPVNSINDASSAGGLSASSGLGDLNLDEFLKMMIAELQNQDPLNPMENHQILQQISQIREIEATDQLRKTLDHVLLGQNLASASNMIGREVSGLAESGDEVTGRVDRVSIEDGHSPKLHVGDEVIRLRNIREVNAQQESDDWLYTLLELLGFVPHDPDAPENVPGDSNQDPSDPGETDEDSQA